MKQLTNANTTWVGAVLLGLVAGSAAVTGAWCWMTAGILGLAALGFSASLPPAKLAPVRICSQSRRF